MSDGGPAAHSRRTELLVGVDIGGTFTDVVLLERSTASLRTWKVLTTPTAPEEGVLRGVAEALEAHGYAPADVVAVIHATTLVTNAIIERKGEPTAYITSRGFKDTLAIGRELRYDLYDLDPAFPEPLVPPSACLELTARGDASGGVVAPVDPDELRAVLAEVESRGIRSVAVNLLHSYANPGMEEEVGAWFTANAPATSVSLASDVAREIGEYERGSTVAANAYVKPVIGRYLVQVQEGLADAGFDAPLLVMHSAGGFFSPDVARRHPIRLLESGPAAGVLAATHAGSGAGLDDLIGFDMGGTTAKACLIQDGAPDITFSFEAGRVHRFKRGSGLPILTPSVDLIEIGAGGGSIATIDPLGLLQVGPASAGSEPGPACYGRGGSLPTVTDADLLLGYLDPGAFLGGRMRLDPARARRAVETELAGPLGLTALEAAWGIHQVVNENMASAARIHLAEKAADPRRLTLVATGGAGPVHAFGVARSLGCARVLYPSAAGVGSAVGLLVVPEREDEVQPYLRALGTTDEAGLLAELRALEARARARIRKSGFRGGAPSVATFSADMRYRGQGQWMNVPLEPTALDPAGIAERFRQRYRQLFGNTLVQAELEFVNLRVVVADEAPAPRLSHRDPRPADEAESVRPIYVADAGAMLPAAVYQRSALGVGTRLRGPCIIQEAATAIVVNAPTDLQVDSELNVIVRVPDRGRGMSAEATGHEGARRGAEA